MSHEVRSGCVRIACADSPQKIFILNWSRKSEHFCRMLFERIPVLHLCCRKLGFWFNGYRFAATMIAGRSTILSFQIGIRDTVSSLKLQFKERLLLFFRKQIVVFDCFFQLISSIFLESEDKI